MTTQPLSRFTGEPLDSWMRAVPNELPIDAVGLWQIIPTLRRAYDLEGVALEVAARQIIGSLLACGAHPVQGSAADQRWHVVTRFGNNPHGTIDGIIAEWHAMERDPDFGDLWFALPDIYNE